MIKKGLSFCIISNSFSKNSKNIIFISSDQENFDKEYCKLKDFLEDFGYVEYQPLRFECLDDKYDDKVFIKNALEKFGLIYSKELEFNLIKHLSNNFKNKEEKKYQKTNSDLIKFKYQEPQLGEKITLFFYLFLDLGFNHLGRPIIQFSGDFQNIKNITNRNYIKIVKSDFIRVEDSKKPNSIVLSSVKKQKDFLNESGILYSGFFKFETIYENPGSIITKEGKYNYKLIEIKRYFNLEQSIVLETNREGFDELIELSNKTSLESRKEAKKHILVDDVLKKSDDLIEFLKNKIEKLSNQEEFEEAGILFKEIETIEKKKFFLSSLNKDEITSKEYYKIFSFS